MTKKGLLYLQQTSDISLERECKEDSAAFLAELTASRKKTIDIRKYKIDGTSLKLDYYFDGNIPFSTLLSFGKDTQEHNDFEIRLNGDYYGYSLRELLIKQNKCDLTCIPLFNGNSFSATFYCVEESKEEVQVKKVVKLVL